MTTRRLERFDGSYVTLTLLWLALIVAVDPRGEFPLGDDSSYTKMLLNLVDHHRLRLVLVRLEPAAWLQRGVVEEAAGRISRGVRIGAGMVGDRGVPVPHVPAARRASALSLEA